jgi:hypothetical protein
MLGDDQITTALAEADRLQAAYHVEHCPRCQWVIRLAVDGLRAAAPASLLAAPPRPALLPEAKKSTARKAPAKAAAAKKPAAKKPVAKKAAAKKPAVKKPAANKPAVKKPAAKKPVAKKPAAKKTAVKRKK